MADFRHLVPATSVVLVVRGKTTPPERSELLELLKQHAGHMRVQLDLHPEFQTELEPADAFEALLARFEPAS